MTWFIQSYTNVAIGIENFIGSSRVNYAYIASSQNKLVLPNLLIIISLSKYKKALCFLYKCKKVPYGSFYKDE